MVACVDLRLAVKLEWPAMCWRYENCPRACGSRSGGTRHRCRSPYLEQVRSNTAKAPSRRVIETARYEARQARRIYALRQDASCSSKLAGARAADLHPQSACHALLI